MDEEYDCIVLGTGLTECILSGLLSVDGKKVLHLDRNSYYGGASASLNLNQLFQTYKNNTTPPETLGASRDYNVDLVPKFILASGKLVEMLLHTDVTRYLDFQSVNGSYVYRDKKVHKVPASDTEALKSSLMGFLEKRRCKNFLQFIMEFDETDPKTHQKMDTKGITMAQCFQKFGLEPNTIDFMGHAVALYTDDKYLEQPAIVTIKKIQLYYDSLSRYGKSPYIYPLYGLGELPQSFARLSAIYGGTYMLNAPIAGYEYNAQGAITGVKSTEGTVAKCKFVVADPSYFPELVKSTGHVIRVICLLDHPVPNTDDAKSTQIIIPQKQIGRENDIFVCVISSTHNVVPKNMWLAIVATKAETNNDPLEEVKFGLELLGTIKEKFVIVSETFEPVNDGTKNKIFLSDSYDASTHFEYTIDNVLDIYKRITGKTLVMVPKTAAASNN